MDYQAEFAVFTVPDHALSYLIVYSLFCKRAGPLSFKPLDNVTLFPPFP